MGEKSELKREYILKKAKDVFAHKGYRTVTMKDIVEACDISRGGLYLYFGSTEEIFEGVWNEKMFEANNTVMVHIRRLREKVELNPRDAQIIKTVWGVGYKIEK